MGPINPLLAYLSDLELAVGEIANSWRPDDQAYRADICRRTHR